MRNRTTRDRIATATVGALVAGALALSATPASANMNDGYVRGYDTYVGDWGDEGILRAAGLPRNSDNNAVCLWQKVLWAEGAPKRNGSTYTTADIDGDFGRDTAHATAWLQGKWKLSSIDAEVGPETFGRADNNLRYSSGSEARGKTLNLVYRGTDWSFSVRRDGEGIYSFYDGDGHRRNAGYDYRTCG